jgi:predicted PurR-regulated permease PerM
MPDAGSPPTPPAQPASGVPGWAVTGIFLMLLIAGLSYARAFLMPVVLAVLLTLVFSPVRRQIERLGIPSGFAALLIVGALFAGISGGTIALAVPASSWIDRAPVIGWQLRTRLGELRGITDGVQEAARQIEEVTGGGDDPEVQRVKVENDAGAMAVAMSIPAVLAQAGFTLVLLFFLLASGDMFYEKIVHVLPSFTDKRRAMRIAFDIERKLSRYLFTITVINAGLGTAVGLMLWAFGMPNPALFGVLAFLLNFIPYIGALLGIAVALVVGILSLETLGQAFAVAGVYFLLTSLEGQFITPYFVGRRLRLNTVVVFVSVTLFAWLWSVVGMLVATPLLVTIRTFAEHIPALHGFGHFLSARGVEQEEREERPAEAPAE